MPYVTQALGVVQRSADELFAKPLRKIDILASASIIQLWIVPRLQALGDAAAVQVSLSTLTLEGEFAKPSATLDVRYGEGAWPGRRSARLFAEALTPLAAPGLLAQSDDWRTLPVIALSGPRAGWQDWARQAGAPAPPVPRYRFDSFVAALEAARAGQGVVLGSLPLCARPVATGALVRVSDRVLRPAASYWLTAEPDTPPQAQWQALVDGLCDNDMPPP